MVAADAVQWRRCGPARPKDGVGLDGARARTSWAVRRSAGSGHTACTQKNGEPPSPAGKASYNGELYANRHYYRQNQRDAESHYQEFGPERPTAQAGELSPQQPPVGKFIADARNGTT